MEELSIVVLSCSNFSDMWSNDIKLFDYYWRGHPNMYIVSDGYGKYDIENPPNLMIYDGEMSNRLIAAVNNIQSDYILLTFDDYYISKPVNYVGINNLIAEMKSINSDYCGLFKRPNIVAKRQGVSKYKVIPLDKVYQVNFYPCIWKRESLLKVLKNNEDIWKTEVRLTKRARENGLFCLTMGNSKMFPFVDIVRKGKYLISGKRFIKRNKLFLSDRETRSIKETFSLFVQTLCSRILPPFIKKIVKKHLRKKGKIFYSDYENTDE